MDKLMNMYSKITASQEVENNLILEKMSSSVSLTMLILGINR